MDGERENAGVPETPCKEPGGSGAEPAGKNGGGTDSVCGRVNDDKTAGLCLPTEKASDVLTGRNGTVIECGHFKNDSGTVCADRCRCGGAI